MIARSALGFFQAETQRQLLVIAPDGRDVDSSLRELGAKTADCLFFSMGFEITSRRDDDFRARVARFQPGTQYGSHS